RTAIGLPPSASSDRTRDRRSVSVVSCCGVFVRIRNSSVQYTYCYDIPVTAGSARRAQPVTAVATVAALAPTLATASFQASESLAPATSRRPYTRVPTVIGVRGRILERRGGRQLSLFRQDSNDEAPRS